MHKHNQKSPWFPRISDLRRIDAREIGSAYGDEIAGAERASLAPRALHATERDLLVAVACGVDQDEEAWSSVIRAYEMICFEGCAHRARLTIAKSSNRKNNFTRTENCHYWYCPTGHMALDTWHLPPPAALDAIHPWHLSTAILRMSLFRENDTLTTGWV